MPINVVDLSMMPNSELVGIYNVLADKPIKSWKGKKSILVERIEALQDKADAKLVEDFGPGASEEPTADATEEATEEVSADDTEPQKSSTTIRQLAIDLLCKVAYYEDRNEKSGPDNVVDEDHANARSVGIPYNQVLDAIREQFSVCSTSVECLRWYAVKIRGEEAGYEGLRLCQRRPRVK